MSIVEIRNINKKYPSFKLQDISFNINEGRITGFIGRNGAGKTTTIKSMLNLIHLDGGTVEYFGKSLLDNETDIKKHIGYSSGSVNYYPRKKIKDIIDVASRFYDTWDSQAYKKYLSLFKLDENKTPIQLSDGMKVKFNLLLALSHKCKVLILDEPTSGLDPFSRNELLDIFLNLKKDGVAIFFSTHIISDIEKCADDIVYISNGKIVTNESLDSFISNNSINNESLEDTFLRLEGGFVNE